MKKLLMIFPMVLSVLTACFASSQTNNTAQIVHNQNQIVKTEFIVERFCDNEEDYEAGCQIVRKLGGESDELMSFSNKRLSEVEQLTDDIYYYHISCGNSCGYGHYVSRYNQYITEDNEILFDKEKKCLIHTDGNKILAINFNKKVNDKPKVTELFDFDDHPKYQNEQYKELLNVYSNHLIFKEDATLNDKHTLKLYSFGKTRPNFDTTTIDLIFYDVCQ